MLLIILLIVSSVYLFTRRPNVNKIIDQSISEQIEKDETIDEDINENSDEEILNDYENNESYEDKSKRNEPVADQLKGIINDTVERAVHFFKKSIHITAIGDSLTKGVGDNTNQGGYIGILDQTINHSDRIVDFSNFGKSGNRTDQLLERLTQPEIIDSIKKSDIVLVTIGANDITLVVKENITNLIYSKFVEERKQFEVRLSHIVETIDGINADTDIYLLGFYNPFKKYFPEVKELDKIIDDWNKTGELVTSKYENATFVPIKDLFDKSEKELFSDDHFHPNLTGYRLMAERVLEYLTEDKEE